MSNFKISVSSTHVKINPGWSSRYSLGRPFLAVTMQWALCILCCVSILVSTAWNEVNIQHASAQAASAPLAVEANFSDSLLIDVKDIPTGLTMTPDGRLLIALKYGALKVFDMRTGRIVKDNALSIDNVLCTDSERGLESVTVDPDFSDNRLIYIYHTYNGGSGNKDCAGSRSVTNRVLRYRLDDNNTTSEETVIVGNMVSLCGNHNGGDLHFGVDGKLYISTGDGGCRLDNWAQTGRANNNARQMSLLAGKILRLNPDGSIPSDNPYINAAGATRCGNIAPAKVDNRVCQEIFATGLRNPFKMAFSSTNDRFYINDVGQDSWEEINIGAQGADYGWNESEGKGSSNFTNPIYAYGHQGGLCSVTGGAIAYDQVWPAPYDNTYFFGDYCGTSVYQLVPNGNGGYTRATIVSGYTTYGGVVAMLFNPNTAALYYSLGNGQVRCRKYTGGVVTTPRPTATKPIETATKPNPTATQAPTASPTPSPTSDPIFQPSPTPLPQDSDAPRITLLVPSAANPERRWVGDTIELYAQVSDSVDGDLSDSLVWDFYMHPISLHRPENEHIHPLARKAGALVSIVMPPPEDIDAAALSYVEVRLSVNNSRNKTSTLTYQLLPERVALTLMTIPTGLQIQLNSAPYTAPDIVLAWAGQQLPISVETQQIRAEQNAWSNKTALLNTTAASPTLAINVPIIPSPYYSSTLTETLMDDPVDSAAPRWLQLKSWSNTNVPTSPQLYLPLIMSDNTLPVAARASTSSTANTQYRFVRWSDNAPQSYVRWIVPFEPYTRLVAEFEPVADTIEPTSTPDISPTTTPRATNTSPATPAPVATSTPLATPTSSQFGSVPEARLARLSRSANVTRWFNNPVRDTPDHFRNYLTSADITLLNQLNITSLRLAVRPELIFNPNTPTVFKDKIVYLDQAIDWLIANKIAVVLELHDNQHKADWEQGGWYLDQIFTFWQALAKRYADRDPDYLLFEIVNEPRFVDNPDKWAAVQTRWVTKMRTVVPNHTLIGSGSQWSLPNGLIDFDPVPGESNMIYTFHLYDPFEFTHQGAQWMGPRLAGMHDLPYPSSTAGCMDAANALSNAESRQSAQTYCQSKWGLSKLEVHFSALADWRRKHNLPIWMGEFGAFCEHTDSASRGRWLRDARALADKYETGWSIWGYDDCFGLNRRWINGQLTVDPVAEQALK